MKPRFAIGNSDFTSLRQQGSHFVDKSLLIADVVSNHNQVILLPRPRRFGKTLAMTMLKAWFEPGTDNTALFSDLAVWQAGDEVRATFGRRPVIFLSFRDLKQPNWPACRAAIAESLAELCSNVGLDTAQAKLDPAETQRFERLRDATASDAELHKALKYLTNWLRRAHGESVVILIDEYDTPIISGWTGGYYDEVVGFFREFFGNGLKDNPHLFRGVLTGILRVAKESLFSGLNNLSVYSILSKNCADSFGFTNPEVAELARLCSLADHLPQLEAWYNGYIFGGQTIYNPWSVLNYLKDAGEICKPYWVNTASDDLLRELLVRRNPIGVDDWQTLLAGGSVRRGIDENMALRGIESNASAVWSLLLFSGYLKAAEVAVEGGVTYASLAVPNAEVRVALHRLFAEHLNVSLGASDRVATLCKALLSGDLDVVEDLLGQLALAMLSYHDVASRPAEAVYQAFVLGLVATMERTHEVTSNRESGYGRYDVLVCPRVAGEAGVVLELKVPRTNKGETAEQALAAAAAQLVSRDYAAVLRERGAQPVWQYAVVFKGKRVWVRAVGDVACQTGGPGGREGIGG